MSLQEFCKEWAWRAWTGRFKRAKEFHGVAALACGFLALLIRELWPAMSPLLAILTWAPFLIFGAVFLAVLAYGLLTAPHAIYVEQVARTDAATNALAELRKPVEQPLEFVNPGELALGSVRPMRRMPSASVYRVALRNKFLTSPIGRVEMMLRGCTDLETNKRVMIAREVEDMRGNKQGDIAPGSTRNFNLVLVRTDKSPPRLYLAPWNETLSPHTNAPGRYQLEIEVTSAAAPPLVAHFLLSMAPNGKVTLTLASLL
jgi:hypothetical protein